MYVYANTVVSSNMSSRFAWLYKIVQKVRITYLLLRQVGKSALSKVLLGRHFSNKELFSYFSLKWKPSAHLNNYIKLLIIYKDTNIGLCGKLDLRVVHCFILGQWIPHIPGIQQPKWGIRDGRIQTVGP